MSQKPLLEPVLANKRIQLIAPPAAIVVLVLLAYIPAFSGEFIWDDDANIINNLPLRTLDGLRRIWFELGATQQYYPLTHSSFWVEYQLWGLNPLSYHVINILLHALGSVLFWVLLRRLSVRGAWLGAALFAVHPVCVETVAWVTERKNTLSICFFLGSLLACCRFWLKDTRPEKGPPPAGNAKFYWLGLGLYVCALWAKTATVPMPAVVLLLIWWKKGMPRGRDIALLVPFFLAGLTLGVITVWVEYHNLQVANHSWGLSWLARCLIAAKVMWFYLGKLAWPNPLIFIYPRWVIHTSQIIAWIPLLALAFGLLILWRYRATWGRTVFVVLAYFLIMLFPVIGFFNTYFFRYSYVNDHFQYLAALGPLALAGAGISLALDRLGKNTRLLQPMVCGALLLTLGALTWRHAGTFHSIESLWRASIAGNPDARIAQNNLGIELCRQQRFQEAESHLARALNLEPDYFVANYNFGYVLTCEGRFEQSLAYFRRSLELEENPLDGFFPRHVDAHYNLALALDRLGRTPDAVEQYEETLKLDPGRLAALNNLAWILAVNPDEKIRNGAKAVQLAEQACRQTEYREPQLLGTLAAAYAEAGDFPNAVATATKARDLARASNQVDVAAKNEELLQLYRAGKPFHAPPN